MYVIALFILMNCETLVLGKISILQESEAVSRKRELRAVMSKWSQSLSDDADMKEFKELKAESSPLGIIEAGRYLIDRDILNRWDVFMHVRSFVVLIPSKFISIF